MDYSKPVKQDVNGTVILPPLVFPGVGIHVERANMHCQGIASDRSFDMCLTPAEAKEPECFN